MFGYSPYRWQKEEIAAFCDINNRPPLGYIQIAKKNGKTALAVMVTLCELILWEERHIYAVSDSETNLSSVYWLELKIALARSNLAHCFIEYQRSIEYPETGSFVQVRPGNFAASQGINPHLVLADEVHLLKREVWNGYQMSTDARENALVLGVTTPGYNLDCAAHELYKEAKASTDPDLRATIYEPADRDCALDDVAAWKEANPAYDESPALRKALRRHCKRMPENDFRRFRLGQWTSTEKAWLPYGRFAALKNVDDIPEGARVWLALDGSWSGDTTAIVACDEQYRLQVVGHWAPPIMNTDKTWRVPMSKVEQALRNACALWEVEEIAFDPARWARTMQGLEAEGLPVVEYPQSPQRMAPATTIFYDAVMDERLSWIDNEYAPALVAHIAAAETEETKNGSMIRKPAFVEAYQNVDCAVAAIMAHDRAARALEPTDLDVTWIRAS
jgi:phage terminase large subunit-like protein